MRRIELAALPFLLALGGCGSDSPSGGNPVDTTAPGLASVTAVDRGHLRVTFNEPVTKATSERPQNYRILETAAAASGLAAPGDTIHVASAALDPGGTSVLLSTQSPLLSRPYAVSVTGVEDLMGNRIGAVQTAAFTGNNAADTTPPQFVARTPGPGATGIGIGESVILQFNEIMDFDSVRNAFSWTSNGGPVNWQAQEDEANRYIFTAVQPLSNNRLYTVTVNNTARDLAGIALGGSTTWAFTTTSIADNTGPSLVSSIPANGSVNVALATNLSLTFSEAVDPVSSLRDAVLNPDPGDGVLTWSNDRRTLTFDPDLGLAANTQYTLVVLPGGVRDLAGNGNSSAFQVAWTTGAAFHSGRFSGVIAGDPGTPSANPAGALVIAADDDPFGSNDDFGISGTGIVGANGAYSITGLADGWYFPVSALDSNGDGNIDPELGDAIGAYGVVLGVDNQPDSVQISGGGALTAIDFALFDAAAISGVIEFSGIGQYEYAVGVFDTTGFDPDNVGSPVVAVAGSWPFQPQYRVNEFDDGLEAGTYYVAAYIDTNFNGSYDVGVDPFGIHGGAVPAVIALGPGDDALDVDIVVQSPSGPAKGQRTNWARAGIETPESTTVRWIRQMLSRLQ